MGNEKVPGRELDALVAKKVMGWEFVPYNTTRWRHVALLSDFDPEYGQFTLTDEGACHRVRRERWDIWSPSTDIAAAWLVVENMIARGEAFSPIIQFAHFSGLWRVAFSVSQARDDAMRAESLPLAICRAALAVAEAKPTPENHSPSGGSGESE